MALASMTVPVVSVLLGATMYVTKPSPASEVSSGGRKPSCRVAGRHIERRGVDGCEGPRYHTGLLIERSAHVHIDAGRAAGVDARLVRFQAGRHRVELPAEAEIAELEGAPIEVRIELLGDLDDLRRGRGGRLVLEVDGVGEGAAVRDESRRAVAGRAGDEVGVRGRFGRSCGCVDLEDGDESR